MPEAPKDGEVALVEAQNVFAAAVLDEARVEAVVQGSAYLHRDVSGAIFLFLQDVGYMFNNLLLTGSLFLLQIGDRFHDGLQQPRFLPGFLHFGAYPD